MKTKTALLILAILVSQSSTVFGQAKVNKGKNQAEVGENPFPNRLPSPDLEGGVEWLNTAGPISLKDLKGKIVLLDFWTFCCINCMHVLPDLEYLEKKFPNELVVIGVHSAKFDNEKETGNIRKAILRYEIAHPVVNDANMTLWRKFDVHSWPTLVLIDPEGNYCGSAAGEGNREGLEKVIENLIAYHKAKGTLDENPVRFDLERGKVKETPLRFPGKILADEPNRRLFISDSNHNRVVVCQLDGTLIDVIGSGAIGQKDGSYSEAEFDRPQGMALVGDTLYVADTENHLLRTVDLANKTVTTLAGTGAQNRTRAPGGTLQKMALNSPWDLTVVDNVLYVAMAGPHQIWSHKIGSSIIWQYAGSGREDIIDGPLAQSALAQPSGIVSDGNLLYVVDSEGSAVRKISTDPKNDLKHPKGTVSTIAGTHDLPGGRSLFAFGDVDGAGENARFQHPLGIALHDNVLFVADSYNHKIRSIDLKTDVVSTWAGTGKSGAGLAPLELSEPAGVAIIGDTMYIADTNNHRIVVVNVPTKEARELAIAGLAAPKPIETAPDPFTATSSSVATVEAQELAPGPTIEFEVTLDIPEGYKLNELFPASYRIRAEGEQSLIAAKDLDLKQTLSPEETTARFNVPTIAKSGKATLLVSVTYGFCRDTNGGVCKVASSHWKIPVSMQEGSTQRSIKIKTSKAGQ